MKVLDTDVCIEILRENPRVLNARSQTFDLVVTTWITACELFYGAANSSKPQHNQLLVQEFLATLSLLDFNHAAAELFGRNKALLKQAGNTVADADLMISSITLAHGATLVTGNIRHYERIPHLLLENWIRS